jgi:hypothetical protein
MKTDEALDPLNIGRLRAGAVAVETQRCPNLIEQFGRLGSGQNRLTHLAVYLAGLPSRGQEIDGRLQSNSR